MAARYPAARSRLPVKAQRRDPPRPYDGRVQRDASSIFEQLAEHATLPVERARMLPLEAYRSPAVLAAEIDTLFGRDWLCVGRAANLANAGDFIVTEIPVSAEREAATRSLVVLRSDDGQIVAFDNVCVHRGARLLDGCGAVNRITCPYHAWVYRLDGSLIGGPHLQQTTEADGRPFEPDAHALAAVRTEVWNDFVFVTLDPHAEPLAAHVARAALPADVWRDLGRCVRRFHDAGVCHADLNVHNLLLDDERRPWLLDFDRGRVRPPGGWRRDNLDRFLRSLRKLRTEQPDVHIQPADWQALLDGYGQTSA